MLDRTHGGAQSSLAVPVWLRCGKVERESVMHSVMNFDPEKHQPSKDLKRVQYLTETKSSVNVVGSSIPTKVGLAMWFVSNRELSLR
jgi:hypothetical protein